MPQSNSNLAPSLLESQSCGGDRARKGFSFQDSILLAKLPIWFVQESFTQLISEAIGDIEVQFFHPRYGMKKELLEVKNHSVQPKKFWDEIQRFFEIQVGSPETYRRFYLVTTGVSNEIKPLLNGLKRLRDPENFYDDSPPIQQQSYNDYLEIVKNLGQNEDMAKFIFDKVSIEINWSEAKTDEYSSFNSSLVAHFQKIEEEVPGKILRKIFEELSSLVKKRQNKPIKRTEIEDIFKKHLPAELSPTEQPIKLLTKTDTSSTLETTALPFEWTPFFGGEKRIYPPSGEWQNPLMQDLYRTRDWIINERSTRRIRLQGSRRLSASIAIGSVFSAVAGFSIESEYRGEIWATDARSGQPMLIQQSKHQTMTFSKKASREKEIKS